jgi:isoleucyl-tRNA synthetase
MNVSSVVLTDTSDNAMETTVGILAKVATGTKCERCWRYTGDVGNEAKYPTVCLRCADALNAIGYPPYATQKDAV